MREFFSQQTIVLLVLFLVMLAGIVTILAAGDFDGRHFFAELGIALVIASIVAFMVELYSKQSLFGEIAQRISNGLRRFDTDAYDLTRFQRLPTDIRDRARDQVLGASLIERGKVFGYVLDSEIVTLNGKSARRATFTIESTYEHLNADNGYVTVKQIIPRMWGAASAIPCRSHQPAVRDSLTGSARAQRRAA